jgi:excisionase family DNA binding protein
MKTQRNIANEAGPSASARQVIRDPRTLLTVEEVAELLRVPVSWVYERTRKRSLERIPGFRLGKYWRFRQADEFAPAASGNET